MSIRRSAMQSLMGKWRAREFWQETWRFLFQAATWRDRWRRSDVSGTGAVLCPPDRWDKPDLIKLMITGGVLDAKVKGEPGELKMSPEIVKAACEEAHALGLQVAAHVESPQGVQVALENGVDTIEHGAMPTEAIIQLFKDRKACQVATLSPCLTRYLTGLSAMFLKWSSATAKLFSTVSLNARRLMANGIPNRIEGPILLLPYYAL